jgi:hypothetical protein
MLKGEKLEAKANGSNNHLSFNFFLSFELVL